MPLLPMARPHQTERSAPPGDPSARWLPVPLLLAAAASWRVLDGSLLFEDLPAVAAEPALRDLPLALRGALPALLAGRRPLAVLTFAVQHATTGLSPVALHAASLLLHLGVAALAFAFLRAVLRLAGAAHPTGLAVAAAGAFALHPVQSAAVSSVAQRGELLAAAAVLGALLLLLEAERRGPDLRGIAAWLGALAAFALGLGSAAAAATLPLAWPLLTFAVPTAAARATLSSWPRRVLLLVPFAAVEVALALRGPGPAQAAGAALAPRLPPLDYLLTQWRVLLTYLRLLAWPEGQSVDWAFTASRSLADPAVIMAGLALLALLAAAASLLSFGRRWPDGDPDRAAARLAAFGLAWFLVTLAATSSVFPQGELLAEHRVYLAALGVYLAAAVGAERLLAHQELPAPRRSVAAALATGAVWLGLAAALHRRNAAWESAEALFTDAVEQAPARPHARLGLGRALLARGDREGAIHQYRDALAGLDPDEPADEGPLQEALGAVLVEAGRPAEALEPLRRVVELEPERATALAALAEAALLAGQAGEAERAARRALVLAPGDERAARVLSRLSADRDRAGPQGPDGDAAPRPQR